MLKRTVDVASSYELYEKRKRTAITAACEKRIKKAMPEFCKIKARPNGYFDLQEMQRVYPTFKQEPEVVVSGNVLDPLCHSYHRGVFAKAMAKGKKRLAEKKRYAASHV